MLLTIERGERADADAGPHVTCQVILPVPAATEWSSIPALRAGQSPSVRFPRIAANPQPYVVKVEANTFAFENTFVIMR